MKARSVVPFFVALVLLGSVVAHGSGCSSCESDIAAPGWEVTEEEPPGEEDARDVQRPDPDEQNEMDPQPPPPDEPTNGTSGVADDVEPLPEPCESPDRPDRCSADPEDFAWSTAALLDALVIEGTEDEPVCCFDLDGDGDIDNSFGVNFASFGFLRELNERNERLIERGNIAIALEFDGLEPGASSGEFRLNWWLASWGPSMEAISPTSNQVRVDGAWVDAGTQPHTYFPNARLADGVLTATDGVVRLPLELFEAELWVTARQAQLRAHVAMDRPVPTLDTGSLGAAIPVAEIFYSINRFIETSCDCLGLEQPLIDKESGQCDFDIEISQCDAECAEVAGACNLYGALGLFADIDRDGDGVYDSVSIGASFTAVPATIDGIDR